MASKAASGPDRSPAPCPTVSTPTRRSWPDRPWLRTRRWAILVNGHGRRSRPFRCSSSRSAGRSDRGAVTCGVWFIPGPWIRSTRERVWCGSGGTSVSTTRHGLPETPGLQAFVRQLAWRRLGGPHPRPAPRPRTLRSRHGTTTSSGDTTQLVSSAGVMARLASRSLMRACAS